MFGFFFDTIHQKDAEFEQQQEQERQNGEGEWDDETHYYDRGFWYQMTIDPPTPWHGRTAAEKLASFFRWF